jgi:catechol 2,3-dioxygenase-like lactoylglutathione lyase family enzyme
MGESYIKLVEILHSEFPNSVYFVPPNRRWGDIEYCEFCFRVLNVETTFSELKSKGAQSAMEVTKFAVTGKDEGDVVSAYAYVRDPDGALVEFSQVWQDRQKVGIDEKFTGIISLAHVGLGVTDMERSNVFYKDILGLRKVIYDIEGMSAMSKMVGEPLRRRIVMLGSEYGMSAIELIQAFPPYRPRIRAAEARWGSIGAMEMGVEVKDIDKICQLLSKRGIQFINPPSYREEMKAKYAYIRNPDGLETELIEYLR